LVRNGHIYILETPLFRVRNKKQTFYCYSEEEKQTAIKKLGSNPEITRFKGLGEISPDEFGQFIGDNIRLEPILVQNADKIKGMLEYYMGSNTRERQEKIIQNLRIETDIIDEELPLVEKPESEFEPA
jgi:topoisomerase-4 subunit B